jgi:ABC-type uncharacterized transport system permease subunit
MAAPLVELSARDQQPPPMHSFGERIRRFVLRMTPAVTAVMLGILMMTLIGSILIMVTAPSDLGISDRFYVTSTAYSLLLSGAFGSLTNLSYTLDKMAPLVLAGFSVAVAYRAGLFNIGAQGQIAIGGTVGIIIGIRFASAPAWVLAPAVFIAAALGGALWGAIVGALKAWRGAHEVVTTIMLNFIAYAISAYIVECTSGCLPGVGSIRVASQPKTLPMGAGAALPSLSHIINLVVPGAVANEQSYLVNVGLLLAIGGAVLYWFLMKRTTLGYEIRAVGQSQKAARYAGINVRRNITLTMLIAGAFAGAAGALIIMGPDLQQAINDQTFRTDTTGFDAISVALLGLNGPVGVVLSGFFFAALIQGAGLMSLLSTQLASNAVPNIPNGFSVHNEIIQFAFEAVVLFLIAGQVIPQFRTTVVRLLARLRSEFNLALARLPTIMLGILAATDVVACIGFAGFVLISLTSLSDVASGVSGAIGIADVNTPATFLLIFYIAGLLLIAITLVMRFIGNRLKQQAGSAALLAEALPTPEALSTALAAPPLAEIETQPADSPVDAPAATPKED